MILIAFCVDFVLNFLVLFVLIEQKSMDYVSKRWSKTVFINCYTIKIYFLLSFVSRQKLHNLIFQLYCYLVMVLYEISEPAVMWRRASRDMDFLFFCTDKLDSNIRSRRKIPWFFDWKDSTRLWRIRIPDGVGIVHRGDLHWC